MPVKKAGTPKNKAASGGGAHKPRPTDTISKNGKRVPASEKGKEAKKHKANAKRLRKVAESEAQKADKAYGKGNPVSKRFRDIAKAAGVSDTTRLRLIGLVEEFDRNGVVMEDLKGQRSRLKGEIAEIDTEIHGTPGDEDLSDPDARKKLLGLEKDRGKKSLELGGVEERLSAAKEMRKAGWQETLDIIRDLRDGHALFDQNAAAPGSASIPPDKTAVKPGSTHRQTESGAIEEEDDDGESFDYVNQPIAHLATIRLGKDGQGDYLVSNEAIEAMKEYGWRTIRDINNLDIPGLTKSDVRSIESALTVLQEQEKDAKAEASADE